MPVLSMFYGTVIRMYYRDDKKHCAPHIHDIHAQYSGHKAVISIMDGSVLSGELPANKL